MRERTIDRWRGVELHVRAEVVVAGAALSAPPAVLLWLDGHPLADPVSGTSSPTATIRPDNSWPRISGAVTTKSPIRPCR